MKSNQHSEVTQEQREWATEKFTYQADQGLKEALWLEGTEIIYISYMEMNSKKLNNK